MRLFVLEWRSEGRWGCKFWTVWDRYNTIEERDQAATLARNKYGRLGWVFRNKQ